MILKRLALNPGLTQNPPSIGLTRYGFAQPFDEDGKISQSTTLEKAEKLEQYGLIQVVKVEKLRKRKPILTFDITILGLVRLLNVIRDISDEVNEKKIEELVTKSQRLIPKITRNWSKLKQVFDIDILIKSLLHACDISIKEGIFVKGRSSISLINSSIRVASLNVSFDSPVPVSKIKKERLNNIERLNNNVENLVTFNFYYNLIPIFSKLSSKEWVPKGTSTFRFRSKKVPSVSYLSWENRYGRQVKELSKILSTDRKTRELFLWYLRTLKFKTYDSEYFMKTLLRLMTNP